MIVLAPGVTVTIGAPDLHAAVTPPATTAQVAAPLPPQLRATGPASGVAVVPVGGPTGPAGVILYDGDAPPDPSYPYLRVARDQAGDVQMILLGTET